MDDEVVEQWWTVGGTMCGDSGSVVQWYEGCSGVGQCAAMAMGAVVQWVPQWRWVWVDFDLMSRPGGALEARREHWHCGS